MKTPELMQNWNKNLPTRPKLTEQVQKKHRSSILLLIREIKGKAKAKNKHTKIKPSFCHKLAILE
jgi:hypothetical protein